MINLTLPDGQTRQYDKPVTGDFVAKDIGPGLAKAALAIRVDGLMKDLSFVIEKDCKQYHNHGLKTSLRPIKY